MFEYDRFKNIYRIAECNDALIYPGIGFGAILSSRSVADTMLIEGAKRLASLSPTTAESKNFHETPYSLHRKWNTQY